MARPTTTTTTVAPTAPLATDQQVRDYLGLPPAASLPAPELEGMVAAATALVDGPGSMTEKCWRERTLQAQLLGSWPCEPPGLYDAAGFLEVVGPVASLGQIQYRAGTALKVYTGTQQAYSLLGRTYVALGPAPDDYTDELLVTYTTPSTAAPDAIRLAMLAIVSDMWTHRGHVAAANYQVTPVVKSILGRYSVARRVAG